jgi:hypothetical protein
VIDIHEKAEQLRVMLFGFSSQELKHALRSECGGGDC